SPRSASQLRLAPRLAGASGLARMARKRAVRSRAARLALQRALGGAAAAARHWAPMDAACAHALARALALAGERHAGAARLRQADGDRLLGRAGAVFCLPDVLDFLANEFARDRTGGLTLARLSARAFECAFFGHGVSFRRVSSAPLSRPRAPCAASSTGLCRRD